MLLRGRLVAGHTIVNFAFLGLAEIEDAASALAVNENGGFRVGALPFCFGFPVLPFKEHVFGMAVCLPCGSLRNPQRLLAFLRKRLHLNLHERFDFCPVAFAVRANGLLPDFGKKKRVAARSFRATGARSRLRKKCFVLRVKRCVCEVKMDFPLNPCAKLPHRGRLGLLVFQDGR